MPEGNSKGLSHHINTQQQSKTIYGGIDANKRSSTCFVLVCEGHILILNSSFPWTILRDNNLMIIKYIIYYP